MKKIILTALIATIGFCLAAVTQTTSINLVSTVIQRADYSYQLTATAKSDGENGETPILDVFGSANIDNDEIDQLVPSFDAATSVSVNLLSDGYVKFQILDNSVVNFAPVVGSPFSSNVVSLKISVTDFVNSSDSTQTLDARISTVEGLAPTSGTSLPGGTALLLPPSTIKNDGVSWILSYPFFKLVNMGNSTIAAFAVEWDGRTDLGAGEYTSTVSLAVKVE